MEGVDANYTTDGSKINENADFKVVGWGNPVPLAPLKLCEQPAERPAGLLISEFWCLQVFSLG